MALPLLRRRAPALERTLVFLHIPKTAGMSVRAVLSERCDRRRAFRCVHPGVGLEQLRRMPAARRDALELVEGHLPYGVHRLLRRPATYMTFLRNPVERLLSFYSYVREQPSHYLHRDVVAGGLSLGDCIRRRVTTELDNMMVRQLTSPGSLWLPFGQVSSAMLDEARRHLDRFAFVGITERLDESISLLRSSLGLAQGAVPRLNTTVDRVRLEHLTSDDAALVRSAVRLDQALYRHALGLFRERSDACMEDEAVMG
jgi:hypothetical protein